MDIKRFILSYYQNATSSFYINRIENPTEALRLHIHDYFQIYYVQKGSIRHHLHNQSALLLCGDLFIIPPNVQHYISKDEEDTVFYVISFMPDFLDNLKQSHLLLNDFLLNLTNTPCRNLLPKFTLSTSDTFFVESLINRIMAEFNDKIVSSEDIIKDSTAILLTLFARNYFNKAFDKFSISFETNKQSILHCIDYITAHCNEDITLDEIARYATMSKACFCRLFLDITGMSFNDYLNKKRIEKASVLLSTTDLKITTISTQCGYDHFSTFYRNFKKYKGVSPHQYHRLQKVIK